MTMLIRVEQSRTDSANVRVTTSDVAAPHLVLEASPLAPVFANSPDLYLPIDANGTTTFALEPGTYVFKLSFKNDNAPGAVTINVETNQAVPMEPAGPLTATAHQYQTGHLSFLVSV